MKKIFIIAFAAMVAMNVSAQLNVWENGGLSAQYAIENVDSITFGITSATPESGSGKDGITPLLKIENDYWFISYDEGATWQQEGKAKGEKGDKGIQGEVGPRGEKGDKGDSMFQAVTQDSNFVYLTLLDSTIVKIAKAKESSSDDQPNSEFIFTITYDPNGGEGVMNVDTFWYGISQPLEYCTFEKKGYHCTHWNTTADGTGVSYQQGMALTIDKDITLYAQWDFADFSVSDSTQVIFAQGNLQYNSSTQTWRFARTQYESFMEEPYSGWVDLFYWSNNRNPGGVANPSSYGTFVDWGTFQISNENINNWRTLTIDEWKYLISKRNNASKLWFYTYIENVCGVVFLPDNWIMPITEDLKSQIANNVLNWNRLENAGAVFIPTNIDSSFPKVMKYWSSSIKESNSAYYLTISIYGKNTNPEYYINYYSSYQASTESKYGVRLVKDLK